MGARTPNQTTAPKNGVAVEGIDQLVHGIVTREIESGFCMIDYGGRVELESRKKYNLPPKQMQPDFALALVETKTPMDSSPHPVLKLTLISDVLMDPKKGERNDGIN